VGGYAGGGSMPGALTNAPTVLTQSNGGTNRILYLSGLTNGTLQRLTIAGGTTFGSGVQGAGAYITACSNLTLASCVISNNVNGTGGGNQYGGGLYLANSIVTLTDCVVVRNGVGFSGWAAYGGGLYVLNSTVAITNCLVERNSAGGGNSGYGGGIRLDSGTVTIGDTIIDGNSISGGKGGGIGVAAGTLTMRNVLLYGNTSSGSGYGLGVEGGSAMLNNCTVASHPGDAINRSAGTVAISNSMLWGNVDDIVGSVSLASCDIKDGDSNGVNGCISADPLFQNGYYLGTSSPCVDTGNVTAAAAGLGGRTTRVDGTPDSSASAVDLGYHYATGFDLTYADIYVATNGSDTVNNGTNALSPFKTITKALSLARDGTKVHITGGTYATNTEVFPLTIDGRVGIQLMGTNSATTIVNAGGAIQRVLTLNYAYGVTRVEGLTLTGGRQGIGPVDGYGPGGGVYVYACGDVTFAACSISNNICNAGPWQYGGGLYADRSVLAMTNCTVDGNSINATGWQSYGGGISLASGAMFVRNCVISRNSTTLNYPSYGGGIFVSGGTLTLSSSLLYGNVATTAGHGLYAGGGMVSVINCTIVTNSGQGVSGSAATLALTNCVVWANGMDATGTLTLAYSDVGAWDAAATRVSCISRDPLFQGAAAYNYRLQPASPCIDAGINQNWMIGTVDLAGQPRKQGSAVDMGAYEARAKGTVFAVH